MTRWAAGFLMSAMAVSSCVSVGSDRLVFPESTFTSKYESFRQIVIEEAANNGYGTLSAEVKPSEYNDWRGRLLFQLKTTRGTDQLIVESTRRDGNVEVKVLGAGTRADGSSAAKAIAARLRKL